MDGTDITGGRTFPVTIDLPLDFVHAMTATYAQAQATQHPAGHAANDFYVYVMARGLTQVEEELA